MHSGATANVKFLSNGSGGLVITRDLSSYVSAFTGTVSGFGGMNHTDHTRFIDLTSVSFASGEIHPDVLGASRPTYHVLEAVLWIYKVRNDTCDH